MTIRQEFFDQLQGEPHAQAIADYLGFLGRDEPSLEVVGRDHGGYSREIVRKNLRALQSQLKQRSLPQLRRWITHVQSRPWHYISDLLDWSVGQGYLEGHGPGIGSLLRYAGWVFGPSRYVVLDGQLETINVPRRNQDGFFIALPRFYRPAQLLMRKADLFSNPTCLARASELLTEEPIPQTQDPHFVDFLLAAMHTRNGYVLVKDDVDALWFASPHSRSALRMILCKVFSVSDAIPVYELSGIVARKLSGRTYSRSVPTAETLDRALRKTPLLNVDDKDIARLSSDLAPEPLSPIESDIVRLVESGVRHWGPVYQSLQEKGYKYPTIVKNVINGNVLCVWPSKGQGGYSYSLPGRHPD